MPRRGEPVSYEGDGSAEFLDGTALGTVEVMVARPYDSIDSEGKLSYLEWEGFVGFSQQLPRSSVRRLADRETFLLSVAGIQVAVRVAMGPRVWVGRQVCMVVQADLGELGHVESPTS